MCWTYYSDGNRCMTFDGQVASILPARSNFRHNWAVMCSKDGALYGGGGTKESGVANKLEIYRDGQWRYSSDWDYPGNSLTNANCVTVPEGVLFFNFDRSSYLFNTERETWKFVGNAYVAESTLRYVKGEIWSFQGFYSNYNVKINWNGIAVEEGEKVILPNMYKISFPIVIDQDEYNLIC
ncbi:Oidioi.mRNA.OKI2018_I69.PAR.g10714.t1.cds [Oikopleura dioica]|uniref:Oidioi.mRNA.OKI2018_I69.PAR.g10714.t1.cds n=1 Tax=Oikopleura dioica TaxID=34765 RepID=A0ABN7RV82_OIKDI|nr:Oidioi.mRNA.OKI2018_I69.PAR.g10714.t1.cds [Oikopleura dioica]